MIEGARNALLGYVYQLLLTASVAVREVPSGDDPWIGLISKLVDGELRTEDFGQDATIRSAPDATATAIQFKHSSTPGGEISRPKLLAIVAALDRSRVLASADGIAIQRFAIVTNQLLEPLAEALVEDARSSVVPPPAIEAWLRQESQDATRLLRPFHGDVAAAAAAWHEVLKELAVYPPVRCEEGLAQLRTFGAQHGLLDIEWDQSLQRLVGVLVVETGQGRSVTISRGWLKEMLVGDARAANLDFGSNHAPHISTACGDRLDGRLSAQHWGVASRIPRDVQRELRDNLALHPVVFVHGQGGCGKSLAVTDYLLSVASLQLVWSVPADTATEAVIINELNAARLPQGTCHTDRVFDHLRARLSVANRGRPVLWCIDVDGLDEASDSLHDLRTLIRRCWASGRLENSPASLVLTCRTAAGPRASEDLVRHWLLSEPELTTGVGFVSVGDFSNEELLNAAALKGEEPEQRIIRAVDPQAAETASAGFVGADIPPSEFLNDLRHPVVWGAYVALPLAERGKALDQDSAALGKLAERFLSRFLGRCQRRLRWNNPAELERTLADLACALVGPPPFTTEDWDAHCRPILGVAESKALYQEAATYGLIDREGGPEWRWRHRFVITSLQNRARA